MLNEQALNITNCIEGSTNQAKWATFSPYISWNCPPSTPKRNLSRLVSFCYYFYTIYSKSLMLNINFQWISLKYNNVLIASFFLTNLSLNLKHWKINGLFSQKIHLIITNWPTWIVSRMWDIKHTLINGTMKSIMHYENENGCEWINQNLINFNDLVYCI